MDFKYSQMPICWRLGSQNLTLTGSGRTFKMGRLIGSWEQMPLKDPSSFLFILFIFASGPPEVSSFTLSAFPTKMHSLTTWPDVNQLCAETSKLPGTCHYCGRLMHISIVAYQLIILCIIFTWLLSSILSRLGDRWVVKCLLCMHENLSSDSHQACKARY